MSTPAVMSVPISVAFGFYGGEQPALIVVRILLIGALIELIYRVIAWRRERRSA